MNLYQIVGLSISSFIGNSYETESIYNRRIVHDEKGKGITKSEIFIKYILYIKFENTYYAIHLSNTHCASYSGKLCSFGDMSILHSNYSEIESNVTHIPIKPLDFYADFEVKSYCYDDEDIQICLHKEPEHCVFEFSYNGKCEKNPSGYVNVNMKLFRTI